MVFFLLLFCTDDWLWRRFDAWCSVCLWFRTMRRPLKSPFDGWSDDALGVRVTVWPANSLVDWLAGLLISLTDEWSCHHLGLAFPAILKADRVVFGKKFQSEEKALHRPISLFSKRGIGRKAEHCTTKPNPQQYFWTFWVLYIDIGQLLNTARGEAQLWPCIGIRHMQLRGWTGLSGGNVKHQKGLKYSAHLNGYTI